jgi:hypothetical protein
MSDQVQQHHVEQFKANLLVKYQQQGSKLRDCVSFDGEIRGNFFYADLIGPIEMSQKTVRHGDHDQANDPHIRRQGTLSTWYSSGMVDKADLVRMLTNPTSAYVLNRANAAGRKADDLIIAAFKAAAKEGEQGETTVNFPSGQVIAHASAGLTLAKIIEAAEKLNDAEVPEEGRYLAVSSKALSAMFNQTKVTSADFNTVKALANGTLNSYMGFEIKRTSRLPKVGNIRECYAWHRDAMVLVEPTQLFVDVGVRRDKHVDTQVYVEGNWGALRRQDEGVVVVEIDESAALPS